MGLNYIVLSGEVLSPPEKKHTLDGFPVASFNISVNPSSEDSTEVKTGSLKISAGKRVADSVMHEVHSGDIVLIEGKLYTRTIENRTGQKQKLPYIQATNIKVIKEKNPTPPVSLKDVQVSKDEPDEEEIPF